MKRSSVGIVLAVLTLSTAAWAFSRDLSGSWRAPNGKRVLIVHNTDTSTAMLNWPLNGNSLDFKCDVSGADGSTRFWLACTGEDLAVIRNGSTCTLSNPTLASEGQLIGQFPGRSLQMSQCGIGVGVRCVSPTGKITTDMITADCSGTWN